MQALPPTRLLVFLDSILDADILGPIIARAAADRRFSLAVLMTRRFVTTTKGKSNLLPANVHSAVLPHRWVRYLGQPSLLRYDALLTTAESSAPAHATAHALTRRANHQGLQTFTVQHGLENVGLTYTDREHGPETSIAAQRIYLWGSAATLHPVFASGVANRCLTVGCPKPVEVLGIIDQTQSAILVCENLHWSRFDDKFRQRFLAVLATAAARMPKCSFLVKPHPAGRWMMTRETQGWPENVQLIHDRHPLASLALPELLAMVDGVITTPSTAALDAARAGKAVAIVGYDLDLPLYEPLTTIRSAEEWLEFARMVGEGEARRILRSQASAFVAQVCVTGDAVSRIIEDLHAACRP